MTARRPRVFSGIQPSGTPTLGNLIGAIRNWVRDQDKYDNIFCIVDLHAWTQPRDPEELRQKTWELTALLLSAGLDPEKCLLFCQSHVPEHSQLTWLLTTQTPIGWLNRMTQFKSKSAGSERDSVLAGLLIYPVLMAADILLYDTNYVPVGDDQKQHVELTRDIAQRFNGTFGETFVMPEPMIPPVGARIMDLYEPEKKMDKSRPSGAILLLDTPDIIRKKLSRAVTDSLATIRFSQEQPGLLNLLTIIQALSGETEEQILAGFEGQGYKAVKERTGDLVIEALAPLQERYRECEADPDAVDRILARGAERARDLAHPLLVNVEQKMGFRRSV
jgi:tryptophanyl-tRNA synthetase